MNISFDNFAAVQDRYDRQLPSETEAAGDWTPIRRPVQTDADVEAFIAEVARTGLIEDVFGYAQPAPVLHLAVAQQWVQDKEAVGQIIGPRFWQWARLAQANRS